MSDFRKFPEQRQSLNGDEAAALAREIAPYLDESFDHPGYDRPRGDIGALLEVNAERGRFYPEHLAVGAIWLGVVMVALWRVML